MPQGLTPPPRDAAHHAHHAPSTVHAHQDEVVEQSPIDEMPESVGIDVPTTDTIARPQAGHGGLPMRTPSPLQVPNAPQLGPRLIALEQNLTAQEQHVHFGLSLTIPERHEVSTTNLPTSPYPRPAPLSSTAIAPNASPRTYHSHWRQSRAARHGTTTALSHNNHSTSSHNNVDNERLHSPPPPFSSRSQRFFPNTPVLRPRSPIDDSPYTHHDHHHYSLHYDSDESDEEDPQRALATLATLQRRLRRLVLSVQVEESPLYQQHQQMLQQGGFHVQSGAGGYSSASDNGEFSDDEENEDYAFNPEVWNGSHGFDDDDGGEGGRRLEVRRAETCNRIQRLMREIQRRRDRMQRARGPIPGGAHLRLGSAWWGSRMAGMTE